MGQLEKRYVVETRTSYVDINGVTRYVGDPWFHCPRCGRDGYAGTLGHGCTDCDNHFSHGLPDPLTGAEHRETRMFPPQESGWENEGGK